jgi:hypothetical protein
MNYLAIENKDEELLYNRNKHIADYERHKKDAIADAIKESVPYDGSHYDRFIENERLVKEGDDYSVDVAAPGCGRINYKITRIEENGDVYGVCTSDFVMELEESDVK